MLSALVLRTRLPLVPTSSVAPLAIVTADVPRRLLFSTSVPLFTVVAPVHPSVPFSVTVGETGVAGAVGFVSPVFVTELGPLPAASVMLPSRISAPAALLTTLNVRFALFSSHALLIVDG